MLSAFIDESERDEAFYYLGALICSDNQIEMITQKYNALLFKHSQTFPILRPTEELHGSTMMRAADHPWRRIPLKARFDIYLEALQIVNESGSRMFIETIDVCRHSKRSYKEHFSPREVAFNFILEKINSCSNSQEPRIRIIADEHHTADISRSNFTRYQQFGTFGYKSSMLESIVPEIEFVPSHSIRSLQAADLITYLFNRRHSIIETDPRAQRQKEKLWYAVSPMFNRPRGLIHIWP